MIQVDIYKAKDGWRWRMLRRGRIIAESGEGYKRPESCIRTLNRLIDTPPADFKYVVRDREGTKQ